MVPRDAISHHKWICGMVARLREWLPTPCLDPYLRRPSPSRSTFVKSDPVSLSRLPLSLVLAASLSACAGQTVPSYDPRPVAIPAECDSLIQRAASEGMASLSETEVRTVSFCQHQQLVRAAEEEAAARKLDAHARTAGLALQVGTVVVGATIALLAWVF